MKIDQVKIRDPYILLYDDRYYMYGTRSESCWGMADGFDCFISDDLENWNGPVVIFKKPEGFFADRCYWAPECYHYNGCFYLVTTFGGNHVKKGIYILKANQPTGPFSLFSQRITPADWACIDGTIYFEEEYPYLVFSRSFEDNPDGEMCMMRLSDDFSNAEGGSERLFSAAAVPWAKPVPFIKEEMGIDGDVFFTDGPSLIRHPDGSLCMAWSSWGTNGYAVGQAISKSGRIIGPWQQDRLPIFSENGGHGMFFTAKDGQTYFTLHYPNDKYAERPLLKKVVFEDDGISFATVASHSGT